MNKKIVLFAIIVNIFIMTGCWNSRELHDFAIIGSASIDKDGDQIDAKFEIIKPSSPKKTSVSAETVKFAQGKGRTLSQAAQNAPLNFDQKLFFPHMKVLFISEEIAKEGLSHYIDFIIRDHETREYVNILVAKDTEAKDLVGIGGNMNSIPSIGLEDQINRTDTSGKSIDLDTLDFMKSLFDEGIEPVLGVAAKKERTITSDTGDKKKEFTIDIEGSALFKKDKFVGFLDGTQTRALNTVRGILKSSVFAVDFPEGQITTLESTDAKSKIDIENENGQISAKVKIDLKGYLSEANGSADIDSLDSINQIENSLSSKFGDEIAATIKKVQFMGTDVFGFGQAMHRKYPQEWKKVKETWNEIFQGLKIDVSVKADIQRKGISNEQVGSY